MPTLLAPHFPHYVQMEPSKRPRRPPCRHQANQLAFRTAHKPTFPLPLRSGHLRGGACKSPNLRPRSLLLRLRSGRLQRNSGFCVTHHKEPRERSSQLESELSSRDKRHWPPSCSSLQMLLLLMQTAPASLPSNLRVLRGSWPMPRRAPLCASSLVGNVTPLTEECMETKPTRRTHVGPKHALDGSRRRRRRHCWDCKRTSPPATSTGPPNLRYSIYQCVDRLENPSSSLQGPIPRRTAAHRTPSVQPGV
ncbi:uncharacterized protein BDZ83DRAFT_404088 [Colletotrichum acutatum]|uniref:Uncharacterized protein n=1 Tax=Glomerella acutata TaxID=27357 RepID=A0AAD8XN21_GLOAC|nr:uncharacterized protein BDZ83DRAFT_404088 [Colletotrichum acutatum]KAK1730395.1 hypothetical protein BDZ83DRAFT_404088 [Colletotrichum acutatum]